MNFIPEFKQVLTRGGWVDIDEYYEMIKRNPVEILIVYSSNCIYACPKSFARTYYQGSMVELTTDTSRIILKPNFNINNKKISTLNKGERIPKFFSYQTIDKKEEVHWKGNHFSLYFGEPVQLPIKFESDYILINV